MTTSTPRRTGAGQEDARLGELMRADAAAVADDDLDDETSSFPNRRASIAGARTAAQAPSQVYSIRVPVERLEQVRRLASERNIAPTTMLRQWVLTQLDAELGAEADTHSVPRRAGGTPERREPRGTGRQRQGPGTERLEAATTALAEAAASLTKTIAILADMLAHSSPAYAQLTAGSKTS